MAARCPLTSSPSSSRGTFVMMTGFISFLTTIFIFSHSAFCFGLQVPSNWRASSFTASRDDRIQVAKRAMDQILTNLSLPHGFHDMQPFQAAPIISNLAMTDIQSGSFHYKDPIINVLNQIASQNGFSDPQKVNDPTILWGMACVYAHRAYNDTSLLDLAERAWSDTFKYFVTEIHASSGAHPERDVPVSTCGAGSSAGAVFYINSQLNRSDTQVSPNVVGQFAALSAHLAELTTNETYTKAAVLSATFLRDKLTDPSGLIYKKIRLGDCSMDGGFIEANSGFALQAWSVLADVTNDPQWRDTMLKTLVASTQSLIWTGSDGVVHLSGGDPSNDNIRSSKGRYINAFYEPWIRNRDNSSVSAYIESYIATQYNALRDMAVGPGTDYYNDDWHGPGVSQWTLAGVMASTPVLAIAITDVKSLASTDDSKKSSAPHRTALAAIIGGMVGGLVMLSLVALCLLLLCRRRSRIAGKRRAKDILAPELESHRQKVERVSESSHQEVYIPRKQLESESISRSSDSQEREVQLPAAPDASPPAVPVEQLVELVYQRLQAERPSYADSVPHFDPSISHGPPVTRNQPLLAEMRTLDLPSYTHDHSTIPTPVFLSK